jgi:hypothetical protein
MRFTVKAQPSDARVVRLLADNCRPSPQSRRSDFTLRTRVHKFETLGRERRIILRPSHPTQSWATGADRIRTPAPPECHGPFLERLIVHPLGLYLLPQIRRGPIRTQIAVKFFRELEKSLKSLELPLRSVWSIGQGGEGLNRSPPPSFSA